MTTHTQPPLSDDANIDEIGKSFLETHKIVVERVKSDLLHLSQFVNELGDQAVYFKG